MPALRARRLLFVTAGALAVVLSPIASDAAAPTFTRARHFGTAVEPNDVVLADFNADGRLDVATVSYTPGSVSVLVNRGSGNYRAARVYAAGPRKGSGLAAGDLNGDGRLDLVAGNQSADVVSVLLGKGDGTFIAPAYSKAGSSPNAIAIEDLNGDGKQDVVTANGDEPHLSVLLGLGDGTFAPPTSYDGPPASSLELADLNGDGKLDIAAPNYSINRPSTVSIVFGRGDGTFVPGGEYRVGADPVAVTAVDTNGDRALDLVTANFDSNDGSLLIGNGDGTFKAPRSYRTGAEAGDVAAADLDHDGRLDLVFTNERGVALFPGRGGGRFGPRVRYPTGFLADSLAVGRVNADARPDVVVTDFGDDEVAVLLNASGPLPPCIVPRLGHQKLPAAKRTLRRARCGVGPIKRARSTTIPPGRLISQSVTAETGLPNGSRIGLLVSRGRY